MALIVIDSSTPPPFAAPRLRSDGRNNFAVHPGAWVGAPEGLWAVWPRCHARTRAIGPGVWTYDQVSCMNCLSKDQPPTASAPPERRHEEIESWLPVWARATRAGDELARGLRPGWSWEFRIKPEYKRERDLVAERLESVRAIVRSGEDRDLLGAQWFIPLKFKEIGDILRPIFGLVSA